MNDCLNGSQSRGVTEPQRDRDRFSGGRSLRDFIVHAVSTVARAPSVAYSATAPSRREPFYYKFTKHNYQILIVTRYYVELCGVKKELNQDWKQFPNLTQPLRLFVFGAK